MTAWIKFFTHTTNKITYRWDVFIYSNISNRSKNEGHRFSYRMHATERRIVDLFSYLLSKNTEVTMNVVKDINVWVTNAVGSGRFDNLVHRI